MKYFQTLKLVQLKSGQNSIRLYVHTCFIADLIVCYFREIPHIIVLNGAVHYKKGVGLYSGRRREKLIVAESGGEVVKLLLMTINKIPFI